MNFFIELVKLIIAPIIVGIILAIFSKKLQSSGKERKDKETQKNKLPTTKIFELLTIFVIGLTIGFIIISFFDWFVLDKQIISTKNNFESETINKEKFDVSIIGDCNTLGEASSVFVDGDYAYIADYNSGLQIINVADKENPKITGSCKIEGNAIEVFVEGKYSYVLSRGKNDKLVVVNIENKEKPNVVSDYSFSNDIDESLIRRHLKNELIGISSIPSKLTVVNDYAYVVDWIGLKILDLKNIYEINLLSSCETFYDAYGIYVYGDYAYIADKIDGIQFVDVADKENPKIIGMYDTVGDAIDLFVEGDYIYVADANNGMQVINVSYKEGINDLDINNSTFTCDIGFTTKVIKKGDYLYSISNGDIKMTEIIESEDIIYQPDCNIVGICNTPGEVKDIFVKDDFIYVADPDHGLQIIEIDEVQ